MSEVLQVAVVVSAIIGAAFGLGKLIQVLWRAFRKLGWFLDAALGEPAQGNQPARLGMLDRLAAIEQEIITVRGSLSVVDGFEARLAALEQRFPTEVLVKEGV